MIGVHRYLPLTKSSETESSRFLVHDLPLLAQAIWCTRLDAYETQLSHRARLEEA